MTPRFLYTLIVLLVFFAGIGVFSYFLSKQLPDFDRREEDNKKRDAFKRLPPQKKRK